MKNHNSLTKLTLLLMILVAHSVAQAQDPRPRSFYIDYRPVGITMGQTVRFNFVNIGPELDIVLNWRFLDSDGAVIAQSERPLTVAVGKMVCADVKRELLGRNDSRIEVRPEIEVLSPGDPTEILRQSLEVFDSVSGKTTVLIDDPSM